MTQRKSGRKPPKTEQPIEKTELRGLDLVSLTASVRSKL